MPAPQAVPSAGYFTAESAVRRIGGESVLMLGGGRALLMQAAHPLVAQGVVDHSDYAADPWRRLARTMTALYTIVFGTKAEADRAGAIVQAVHERVSGRLPEAVGPFAAGTRYAAADPALMLWVHATLVDTGIAMHDAYVRRLRPDERAAFYDDMQLVARVFGVPADVLPPTYGDFEEYRLERLGSPELAVGPAARAVARTVLDPPVPLPLRPGLRALGLTSVGLLPEPLRSRYGLRWSPAHAAALGAASLSARRLLVPLLPDPLRLMRPAARDGIPLRVLAAFGR
jgi:uncharacterized protein (DUF2236 family)